MKTPIVFDDARPAHLVIEGFGYSDGQKNLAEAVRRRLSPEVCISSTQQVALLKDIQSMGRIINSVSDELQQFTQLARFANILVGSIGTSRQYCNSCLCNNCKQRDIAFPVEDVRADMDAS